MWRGKGEGPRPTARWSRERNRVVHVRAGVPGGIVDSSSSGLMLAELWAVGYMATVPVDRQAARSGSVDGLTVAPRTGRLSVM